VATGQRVRELDGAGGRALAVSPDGSRLAAGDWGKFDLWDLKSGRPLSDADSRRALTETVFLSPAGDRVYTFGVASLSTWDAATGRRLHAFDVPPYPYSDPGRSHVFSPDGRYAVSFHENQGQLEILVWDVAARRRLHTLRPPGAAMPVTEAVANITRVYGAPDVTCAFSADASLLVTCQQGKEAVVRFWDVRTGKAVRSFKGPGAGWSGRLAFAADGRTLFVAGLRVSGFDSKSGKELFSWRVKPLEARGVFGVAVGGKMPSEEELVAWRTLAVSPEGTAVACILVGSGMYKKREKDRLALYDARSGQLLRRWNDSGLASSRWPEQMTFSRDGRLLATSDGGAVHVWEVATGQAVRTLRGHRGEIQSLVFSADGRRLATASSDSTTLLWDLLLALGAAPPAAGNPGEQEVARWWADLAGAEAGKAYAAVWRLAGVPGASVPFFRQRLRPVTDAEVKAIREHIADLDSGSFAVRQKAFDRLKSLGLAAAPALRQEAEKKLSLEARRRVEQLLENLRDRPAPGESLRTLRALAVLEYAGTPEARGLLQELAGGAADAWLTREAGAAWARLAPGAAH
jgi:WD40 repeat protein